MSIKERLCGFKMDCGGSKLSRYTRSKLWANSNSVRTTSKLSRKQDPLADKEKSRLRDADDFKYSNYKY